MIYAFTAASSALKKLAGKATKSELPLFLYEPETGEFSILFIRCDKTLKEIVDYFDIANDAEIRPVVFLRVTDYYGFASKHLWEWLRVHQND